MLLFVLFWSQQAVSRFTAPPACCSRWWWRWSSQSCSESDPESGCNWTQHAESEPTRHCSQRQKQKVDWQTEVIQLLCWTCTNLDMCCSLKNPEQHNTVIDEQFCGQQSPLVVKECNSSSEITTRTKSPKIYWIPVNFVLHMSLYSQLMRPVNHRELLWKSLYTDRRSTLKTNRTKEIIWTIVSVEGKADDATTCVELYFYSVKTVNHLYINYSFISHYFIHMKTEALTITQHQPFR